MKILSAALQTVFYWVINVFSFRAASISDFAADQCLLFEGATCKVAWRSMGAYGVKLFLNGRFYKNYTPNAVAVLPVHSAFKVELLARSIYGNAQQSLSLEVNFVRFKEAEKFGLNAAAETRPKVHQSLQVLSRPTPAPVLMPLLVTLDNTFLVASRESLEHEIITNSYQSETNLT